MTLSSLLIGILIIFSLGAVAYLLTRKSVKTAAVRWTILVVLLTLAWTLSNYFILRTNTTLGGILNSIAFTTGLLALYSLYMLSQYYPIKNQNFHFERIKYYHIAAVSFAAISALPAITGKVLLDENNQLYFTYPPLITVYVLVAFFIVIATAIRFGQVAHQTKGAVRAQAIILMIGLSLVAIFALSSNTVLPLLGIDVSYQTFGPMIIVIALAFVSYVLSRKAIFDVRPYVARSFVYALSIAVLIGLFVGLTAFAAQYIFDTNVHEAQLWFFAIMCVILALLFRPIVLLFNEITNRYFYRQGYDAQKLTNTVNKILIDADDLHAQLQAIAELMKTQFNVTQLNFYINAQPPLHHVTAGTQTMIFKSEAWAKLSKTISADTNQSVFAETFHDTENAEVTSALKEIEVAMVQKLISQNELVGFLLIGHHRGGNSITANDVQVIETIANEVAIAVQNSRRLLQISKFNNTLKQEINRATAELKSSNEKLQALDEAKDEFISMASHQLRTPLTSVKGYISMVLDGDVGAINDPQRNFLTQAFISSQHMAYLIGDLLNLSRIKTGKFIISPKPTNLAEIIQSELTPLETIARARRVKLTYKKPTDFPMCNLDETKIRQVVMSMAENAIYYTPANGTVTVTLTASKNDIRFEVKDTGIGVSKTDQKQIFQKFYRAQNARHIRPDGTGIGLFMAKRVIDAHSGKLIFASTEGKGSTFGFGFSRVKIEVV